MNKIVILFALVGVAFAEPPSSYGGVTYSAPLVSFSTAGYADYDDGGTYVDDALLAKVAQILEQSEGGYSGGYASTAYGAPAYSSGILLGRPERAQRVAEFDLTDVHTGGYATAGGYVSGGY